MYVCVNIRCEIDLGMGPTGLYSAAGLRRAKRSVFAHSGGGRGATEMLAKSPNEA